MWTVKTILQKENFNVLPRKLPEMAILWIFLITFVKIWKYGWKKRWRCLLYQSWIWYCSGMRGLIGAGTKTVSTSTLFATEGLARLIESKVETKERGVAIAHDSRHSPGVCLESAAVLAKHGIKSYVFEASVQLRTIICRSSSQLRRYHGHSQPQPCSI